MSILAKRFGALIVGVGLALGGVTGAFAQTTLLNVSYDPTRELYKDYNAAFAKHWKAQTGEDVTIQQSHGGSGKQARGVIDGLEADVVTLALESDINAIAENTDKIPKDWRTRLPNNSSPYTSTIVFLVRKGNPKGIQNWGDLVKDDVQIVTPNPKTSGGARWNYLAAWAWANEEFAGDQDKIKAYIAELFKRAPVLDTGARGSLTTFAQRQIGDVLLAWENEAYLAGAEFGADSFDIVWPPISILAEPPVTVVDGNVDAKGTRKQAEAYLEYLYSDEGQNIAAKHYYRPSKRDVVAPELLKQLPDIKLVTIDDPIFGGWVKAQPEHFGDGGVFDQIYKPGN
ncbi:sulfate ABC transporter substrate-binding protein [Shinella yambaruensis]|uniref:Sulfate transporter subunit n=1 Tax=Shinella yambaruensis TaxID=415996 RepID=A0ABQ5ZPR6_9HYPH|nr:MULTISPECIES: sulfate ABC transporter substrate-binding protein [Shinella]CAI0335966.1 sulfate/thiosulfate ABC transporter periplasmic binding protein Sbp [Rhizobiaceae bacterium]CAK7261360.1 sulfate/thiosulfate ABC transporter periplasmic binding protein Sbp [Shinella sp. WSC3-e]MCJ8027754.1 sulfate ABC transporter substrate-binding protein [Shinella yambaruensis]MCU7983204.1 sulfate ABC transporter substrate-binding protein [Shinella yambaruensis]MCW5711061.1 sulfate ABC transporter subst